MKLFLVIIALCGVANASNQEFRNAACNLEMYCGKKTNDFNCNSKLTGFDHVESKLNEFVNIELTTSYAYLMLATRFDTHEKNRPGFHKLFQGLSDKAWDNTISLIKHVTKRGGSIKNIEILKKQQDVALPNIAAKFEVGEIEAMAAALSYEKFLATKVQHLHRRSLHGETNRKQNNSKPNGQSGMTTTSAYEHYDPESAHYLEEEFLEPQVDTIRKLSGYTNDLVKFSKLDPGLAFFLFDEYLQKQ